MSNYTYKSAKFTLKESDDDSRVVKGYAAFFGNYDSDGDVIEKGAFKRTIKANGPEGRDMIKLCAQHYISKPVAKITKLEETAEGLYMEARFGTHTDGEDYYRMTKEGIMNEFSVGFVAVDKEENDKGGYHIKEIKLYEISMVTIAANEKAVVTDVKSNIPTGLLKQIKDEELRFKLEREFYKLQSEKATTLPASEDAPAPEVKEVDLLTKLSDSNTNGVLQQLANAF